MPKVKEIMKQHVVTVDPDTRADIAAKIMSNNRIGSVVLVKNSKAVGIFTTEDITSIVAKGIDPKKAVVKNFAKKKFITASPDDDILMVSKLMVKSGVKRLPVVKKGKLVGIVTDKELLTTSPELIDVLSEKLKARIDRVANPYEEISGICEGCESYSDGLKNVAGRWLCEDCREE